jgi:hypothetical protein
METFAIIWLGLNAAQRLREVFAESPLPDEELHLNSSSAVAHTDGEIMSTKVDPISSEATGKEPRCACCREMDASARARLGEIMELRILSAGNYRR